MPVMRCSESGRQRLASRQGETPVLEMLSGRSPSGSQADNKVGLGSIRRPVIGLALGGGAARGLAHIGIIRTLVSHGILPDVVVGTSIGGVVGGVYAAGQLDALEEWARSLQPRKILGYLDIRLNGSGLIGGDKVAAQLERAIGGNPVWGFPLEFPTGANQEPPRPENLLCPRRNGGGGGGALGPPGGFFAGV